MKGSDLLVTIKLHCCGRGRKKNRVKNQIQINSSDCQSGAPSYSNNETIFIQKYQSTQTRAWLVRTLSICRNGIAGNCVGRQSKRDMTVSSISDPLLYKSKCKVTGIRI